MSIIPLHNLCNSVRGLRFVRGHRIMFVKHFSTWTPFQIPLSGTTLRTRAGSDVTEQETSHNLFQARNYVILFNTVYHILKIMYYPVQILQLGNGDLEGIVQREENICDQEKKETGRYQLSSVCCTSSAESLHFQVVLVSSFQDDSTQLSLTPSKYLATPSLRTNIQEIVA